MPRQILLQLPTCHIPNFQRGVLAPAHEQPAVRAETAHIHGPDVAAQSGDEDARGGRPELDVVVEAAAGEEEARGGKGDVVDGFLVAEEAGEGFEGGGGGGGVGGRGPEVDGGVVGGGDEAFGEGVVGGGRGFEAREGGGEFGVLRRGDDAGVGVVGGAEDGVGGEGEVVDPVGVRGEGVHEGAGGGGPDFDAFVVRGGVDVAGAAPAHARDGAFVT